MKVLLLKDTKGIGRAHEIIEAADGFALNYLIPKKIAVVVTAGALKVAAVRKVRTDERRALDAQLVAQNFAALAEARVVVKVRANEKGHLYDAVGESDIAAAVKEKTHIDLPAGAIRLEKPFKQLGEFRVPIAAGNTFGEFTLVIDAM